MSPQASAGGEVRYYLRKAAALEHAGGQLLANRGLTRYFVVRDHAALLDAIVSSEVRDFYEYVPEHAPVCPYFDVDIPQGSDQFESGAAVVDACVRAVVEVLGDAPPCRGQPLSVTRVVLASHAANKRSFHVVVRVAGRDGRPVFLKDVRSMAALYQLAGLAEWADDHGKRLVDPSVYREGLFRTLHSSKNGEHRPLALECR